MADKLNVILLAFVQKLDPELKTSVFHNSFGKKYSEELFARGEMEQFDSLSQRDISGDGEFEEMDAENFLDLLGKRSSTAFELFKSNISYCQIKGLNSQTTPTLSERIAELWADQPVSERKRWENKAKAYVESFEALKCGLSLLKNVT
jgi:hypothetical protein